MLRIGINALYLIPGGVGGTEIYLRSLLGALARVDAVNRYTVYTNRETGVDLIPAAENFRQAPCAFDAGNRPVRIVYEQTMLPWRTRGDDVLLNPGFTAPLLSACPRVTVFHDMQHKRHPEHFRTADLFAWRILLWASAHRSARLIAVSEATRADLLRYYPSLPPERITVIPHGVDERFFKLGAQRGQPDPNLLCVSTLHPHKNIERLIRAFARVHGRHREWRLTLAGMRGFQTAAIERLIAELGVGGAVRITGWIEREQLYGLFQRAGAFVYPSTFEGFGMPVLEALAAGIPAACSDIEPLRTIAGGAALLFDPLDEGAIEAALERLLRGEVDGAAGPKQAARYRWESAARSTLEVLTAAIGARTSRVSSR
ncbi:MAG: glycosyltransferase family 1 protein [Bryobacteraceae bacterium]